MSEDRITIVHTKRGMLLTKKLYADWRAVQDEFDDYMTSLGPFEPSELVEYLAIEYPLDPPFADEAVGEFLQSDRVDLWSGPAARGDRVAAGAASRFEEAAIEWAGTGYGKPLVDAAVAALMEGLDTPTLRVLAGAPERFADEEASEYAVDLFDELELSIPEKHSSDAYVALAKLKARRLLDGEGTPRQLAADLYMLFVASDYRPELSEFGGLDDWYMMLDDRVIEGTSSVVDEAVRESAERLAAGLPSRGQRLGDPYMASVPEHDTPLRERVKGWLGFKSGGGQVLKDGE